ncbi:hypothetical protein [Actinomycetospora sp. TBRC 11914]|uniref:hypothetical protein n=1 Tax=Actinomycetospora sp. TBRC 11914 TaxID=2729387 RepID=UPI00145CCBC9|nr:hypothetical protein [Actinomycetospora sp. TBRC 11914]NMO92488.1 hypothetical protein [Actinomycetospora sp. TBRC 11914]
MHRTPHSGEPASLPLPAPRPSTDGAAGSGCIGPAWIVREVTHVPGVLRLAAGRLCFTSSRGPVFDLDLGALRDTSGADLAVDRRRGFRVTVGGERLHVHVVRPLGAVDPGAAFVDAVARAADLPATRGDAAAADTWRTALLSGTDDPPRRPGGRFAGRARRGSAGSAPRT